MPKFRIGNLGIAFLNAGLATTSLASLTPEPPPPSGYDLATRVAAVPFAVSLPTAPTITSEAICSTEAEIIASVAVNGRRTIATPGIYTFGALSIGGNDKEIVFQPGAGFVLSELQFNTAARVLVQDAVITSSGQYGIRMISSQDLRFNRLNMASADGGFYPAGVTRFAFISSEIVAYTHVAYLDAGNSHMTIANCNLDGDQPVGGINGWCVRWGGGNVTNTVVMDSRLHCEQNVTIRYENTQTNGYFARNQIEGIPFRTEGQDAGNPSAYPLNNLTFIGNHLYALSAINNIPNVIVTSYPRMQNILVTGNRGYSPEATLSNLGFPSGQATWTLDDNLHIVTAGFTPPVWTMA